MVDGAVLALGLLWVLDIFFAAEPVSLAPLKALDDVQEIVFLAPHEIPPEELAFDSLRHALRCYLARDETPAGA